MAQRHGSPRHYQIPVVRDQGMKAAFAALYEPAQSDDLVMPKHALQPQAQNVITAKAWREAEIVIAPTEQLHIRTLEHKMQSVLRAPRGAHVAGRTPLRHVTWMGG